MHGHRADPSSRSQPSPLAFGVMDAGSDPFRADWQGASLRKLPSFLVSGKTSRWHYFEKDNNVMPKLQRGYVAIQPIGNPLPARFWTPGWNEPYNPSPFIMAAAMTVYPLLLGWHWSHDCASHHQRHGGYVLAVWRVQLAGNTFAQSGVPPIAVKTSIGSFGSSFAELMRGISFG